MTHVRRHTWLYLGCLVLAALLMWGRGHIFPWIWQGVIQPATLAEQPGFWVQGEAAPDASHHHPPRASFTLDRPQTSLTAHAVWQVARSGWYQMVLECDDYGSVHIDRQMVIDLTGLSGHNQGTTPFYLTGGEHLITLTLHNGPGKGWLRFSAQRPQDGPPVLLAGKDIIYPQLASLGVWLSAARWLEHGAAFLALLLLVTGFSGLLLGLFPPALPPEGVEASPPPKALAWSLVGLTGLVLLYTAWLCDDAYITLRVVDNFVKGQGLVWNPGERVQVFTHPLWMFLLSGFYAVAREGYYTLLLLPLSVSITAAVVLARRWAWSAASLILLFALLLLGKAWVDYSTSGLENPLSHLLLILFVMVLLGKEWQRGHLVAMGFLAGLALLNRLDVALLYAPALMLVVWRRHAWRDLGALALGFIPLALWELFSLFYFGLPFPNTAYAKLSVGVPLWGLVKEGLRYLADSLQRNPLTLAAILGGAGLGLASKRPRLMALSVGALLYLLYTVRVGGDYMSGRFLAAPYLIAVLVLTRLPRWQRGRAWPAALALVVVLGLLPLGHLIRYGLDFGPHPPDPTEHNLVTDERAFSAPAFGLRQVVRRGGQDLREFWRENYDKRQLGVAPVRAIGRLAYYWSGDNYILDEMALADPLRARMPATPPWRIGHFYRDVPFGYTETLQDKRNQIFHPAMAAYYDKLFLLVRGPLLDPQRLKEIVLFNLGCYDDLLVEYNRYHVKRFHRPK